jgi:hypothetical protein
MEAYYDNNALMHRLRSVERQPRAIEHKTLTLSISREKVDAGTVYLQLTTSKNATILSRVVISLASAAACCTIKSYTLHYSIGRQTKFLEHELSCAPIC